MSKSKSIGTKLIINGKTVGGLTSIGGIEVTAEATDVTDLANEDGFREKLLGLKDAGEISASGFLDGEDEGQDECYSLLNSGELADCSIVFPAKIGKTWSFKGGISKFSTSADLESAVAFDIGLIVSGKPTLAASKTT